MTNRKIAVLEVESQPPNLGEMLTILTVIDKYDHLFICVSSELKVMSLTNVFALWNFLLKPYADKVTICKSDSKFTTLTQMDKFPEGAVVLTTSEKTLAHLTSIGIPVNLVSRPTGYVNTFFRVAYRQGRAYDYFTGKIKP